MRLCHIGHGRLPIPPVKHGAVESIIADYQHCCEQLGYQFFVINDADPAFACRKTNALDCDVVHLHDERKIDAFANVHAQVKIVTTHDPEFFEKPNPFVQRFVDGDFLIGCLSPSHAEKFRGLGVSESRLLLLPNGARSDLIEFSPTPRHPDRMICLGMIGQRKRQRLLLRFPFVDCIGPVSQYDPINQFPGTFKEWSRAEVCEHLTDYSALVLLSKSEAAPLVVVEALMAGLDVVVSEAASANLDRNNPFIHVLAERTIANPTLLEMILRDILSRPKDRQSVRNYAESQFDWLLLTRKYCEQLEILLAETGIRGRN